MKETFTINAMMEDDMFKSLEKWGFMGALENGNLKCACGETITKENLTAMKPIDKKIHFYCSIICLYERRRLN